MCVCLHVMCHSKGLYQSYCVLCLLCILELGVWNVCVIQKSQVLETSYYMVVRDVCVGIIHG